MKEMGLTRRKFLMLLLAGSGGLLMLAPTPACGEYREPTPSHIEGPYYKPRSPQRSNLVEEGMEGTRLLLRGRVLSTKGSPIPHALLDFWQADANGVYDNAGYRLRGHQFTDEAGRYSLRTIVPGPYPGRTSHIHVKVQAPGKPVLTTQIHFPGDPRNRTDPLYRSGLLMTVRDTTNGKEATFDFVLDLEK